MKKKNYKHHCRRKRVLKKRSIRTVRYSSQKEYKRGNYKKAFDYQWNLD